MILCVTCSVDCLLWNRNTQLLSPRRHKTHPDVPSLSYTVTFSHSPCVQSHPLSTQAAVDFSNIVTAHQYMCTRSAHKSTAVLSSHWKDECQQCGVITSVCVFVYGCSRCGRCIFPSVSAVHELRPVNQQMIITS